MPEEKETILDKTLVTESVITFAQLEVIARCIEKGEYENVYFKHIDVQGLRTIMEYAQIGAALTAGDYKFDVRIVVNDKELPCQKKKKDCHSVKV